MSVVSNNNAVSPPPTTTSSTPSLANQRYLEEISNLEDTLQSLTQSLEHNKKERTALLATITSLNEKVSQKEEEIQAMAAAAAASVASTNSVNNAASPGRRRQQRGAAATASNRPDGESIGQLLQQSQQKRGDVEVASTITTLSNDSIARDGGGRNSTRHAVVQQEAAVADDGNGDDSAANNTRGSNGAKIYTKEGWHFTYKAPTDGTMRDGERSQYVMRLQASNKSLNAEVDALKKEQRLSTSQHEHQMRVADSKLHAARKEAQTSTGKADELAAKLEIVKKKYTEAAAHIQHLEGRLKART